MDAERQIRQNEGHLRRASGFPCPSRESRDKFDYSATAQHGIY
jgi:hypothetical protein